MGKMGNQRGFSLIEFMISMTLILVCLAGLTRMTLQNSRINKSQQLTAEVQSNARNCLALVVQTIRSAGWDPMNAGVGALALDPDTSDDVSEIEVFADMDEDGATTSMGEQILIRHSGDEIAWRRSSDTNQPFVVLATNISNDADGDGNLEAMFPPDSVVNPTSVTVQITAESPVPDPVSGDTIRYTVSSDVILRKGL